MKAPTKLRASALIFIDKKVVITKHDVPDYGVYYLLPGGGVELGESPEEALRREVKEECGIEIDIKRLVYYKSGYTDQENYLDLIFLCEAKGRDMIAKDPDGNVKEIETASPDRLREIRFFPKQIVKFNLSDIPQEATFLGKFKYPED
ncbi:MAG: NUDIX domain-containing protein [Nanoarchaeota archaeon]|nr:NUDIX domain-containing protein [Nanoarchaeota archaeon]